MSVIFMESTINDFIAERQEPFFRENEAILEPDRSNLLGLVGPFILSKSYSPLEKYQIALIIAGKEQLEKGMNPYQDANLLIALRNKLIHLKTSWQIAVAEESSESRQVSDLEKKLRGKFRSNPTRPGLASFFPHRCLSAGCAIWSVKTAAALVDEFHHRVGRNYTYDEVIAYLEKE